MLRQSRPRLLGIEGSVPRSVVPPWLPGCWPVQACLLRRLKLRRSSEAPRPFGAGFANLYGLPGLTYQEPHVDEARAAPAKRRALGLRILLLLQGICS